MFRLWLSQLARRMFPISRRGRRRTFLLFPSRPRVEQFEVRLLPSTFTVLNPNDSGAGTLRQAILDANAAGGSNSIAFHIAPSGVQTIALLSALPAVTSPVVLDGTSEPGYVGMPLVVLNGAGAGSGAAGLTITAGNSTVQGLVIDSFGGDGIDLFTNGGDLIQDDYIGVNAAGNAAAANGIGVLVNGAASNTIGGTAAGARNVISGNRSHGVYLTGSGASGNVVLGNYLGTDVNGTAALGNLGNGVQIDNGASANTVGGTAPGMGNVISANGQSSNFTGGMWIYGSGTSGNLVAGNYVGTDASGTASLGNAWDGVLITIGATDNTVGGTAPGARNIISANGWSGIEIYANGTSGNVVLGNYVGTDASSTAKLGNADAGVLLNAGATANTIGGTTASARNVISGNTTYGVQITAAGTSANLVLGNYVGTDKSGTAALGNVGNGVQIDNGATANTVGGTAPGAGNVISANGQASSFTGGVWIQGSGTSGNVVLGNYVGTDASGTASLGNAWDGVLIRIGATANTVGGTAPGARNIIARTVGPAL